MSVERDAAPPALVSDEMLAAFLEGKLDDANSARVLQHLTHADEARAILDETAELLAALDEPQADTQPQNGGGDPPPQPRDRLRSFGKSPIISLLLAAGLVVFLLVPRSSVRNGDGDEEAQYDGWFAGASLGSDWQTSRWAESRGESRLLSARARSVRLGSYSVDLVIAGRLRDSTVFRRVRRETAQLAALLPAGGAAAAEIAALADRSGVTDHSAVRIATAHIRQLVESTIWYDVGAWAESSRLSYIAGREHDAEWTRHRNASLERLVVVLSDSARTDPDAARVRELLHRFLSSTARTDASPIQSTLLLDSALAVAGR